MADPFKHPRPFTGYATTVPATYTSVPVTLAWLRKQYWNLSGGIFHINIEGQNVNDGTSEAQEGSYTRDLNMGSESEAISLTSDGSGLSSWSGSLYGASGGLIIPPKERTASTQFRILSAGGDSGGFSVVFNVGFIDGEFRLIFRVMCGRSYSAPLRLVFQIENDYGQTRPTSPYEEILVNFDSVMLPMIISVNTTTSGFTPAILSHDVGFYDLVHETYSA